MTEREGHRSQQWAHLDPGSVQWNELMAANLFSILPIPSGYFLDMNKLIGAEAC